MSEVGSVSTETRLQSEFTALGRFGPGLTEVRHFLSVFESAESLARWTHHDLVSFDYAGWNFGRVTDLI